MSVLIDNCEMPLRDEDRVDEDRHVGRLLLQWLPTSICFVASYLTTGCILHSVFFIDASFATESHPNSGPLAVSFCLPQNETDTKKQEPQRATGHSTNDADRIKSLIAQLGDDHYFNRDEAEAELLKIGGPAIEPLRNATTLRGTEVPDGEVQLRATRLLILIERTERERQIRLFLEGKQTDLELAGWIEFSKLLDPDRLTRRIFVDMYQAQPKLFGAIKKGKRELETVYQDVSKRSLRSSSNANATQSVGTMNALMFVAALKLPTRDAGAEFERISISQNDLRRLQAVVTQSQMVTYVNNCGNRSQIETLISNWLQAIPDDDATLVGFQLAVIKAYEMKPQADSVIQFADNQELPNQTRASAIEIFSNLAGVDQLNKLDSLLQDGTVLGSYLPQIPTADLGGGAAPKFEKNRSESNPENKDESPQLMQVQIRDLALIAAIKISGQDVQQYGFQPKCVSRKRFVRNLAGFFTKEARDDAFKKWRSQN